MIGGEDFRCPGYQARYKIARVTVEPGDAYHPIRCKVCGGPLAGTEDSGMLKYFLTDRPSQS
jgi:hypothetical protein